jgi:hypothetical protein
MNANVNDSSYEEMDSAEDEGYKSLSEWDDFDIKEEILDEVNTVTID